MKNTRFMRACSLVGALLLSTQVIAAQNAVSFGTAADNLFSMEMVVHDILQVVAISGGTGLILASIVRYFKYRKNPLAVSLGSVITGFVVGACLIIVAFVPMVMD